MKKVITAISVFAFVFALSAISAEAKVFVDNQYSSSYSIDQEPKVDGTKKAAKADGSKSCGDKSAKASSGDCSKPCGDKDKSAKASSDCNSKKTTTTAEVSSPESK